MNVPKLMRRLAALPVKSGHRKVLARRLGVDPITMEAPVSEVKESSTKAVPTKRTKTSTKKKV